MAKLRKYVMLYAAAACISSCGPTGGGALEASSADKRALETMVAKRMGNPQNLNVSDPVIYRDGDAKLGCVTATWENQFGEAKPEAMFRAWYIPQSASWHTDNPHPPGAEGCQFYADPDWKQKTMALNQASRDAEAARVDASIQDIKNENARAAQAQAESDAERDVALNRTMGESDVRARAESARIEAEQDAQSAAADIALERSLARGPVDTTKHK